MKINWKSVSECERNYVGQEINNGDAEITEIFVADGPICECGKPMQLTKCTYRDLETNEEEESDITSICHECNVEDVGFFDDNSLEKLDPQVLNDIKTAEELHLHEHYTLKEWTCDCKKSELILIGHGNTGPIYQMLFECAHCNQRWVITSIEGKYSVQKEAK